ncbi:DUF551 domain-containing protein [Candidatus Saccharibacteria bacterium]|nr:DUF551 domain-containing protein [Candidatus Saccharibacteria bacterium]
MSERKARPGCGKIHTLFMLAPEYLRQPVWIQACDWCGWRGPASPSPEKAIAAWNTRASEWVSVQDALPPTSRRVICWNANQGCIEVCSLKPAGIKTDWPWVTDVNSPLGRSAFEITHWMPLPEPPEE